MHNACVNTLIPPELPDGVHFFERGWLSSNNILLVDAHQAILIDSGYWTHAEQTGALVHAVLGPRPLTELLNTHLHSDHCGGNALMQARYPGLRTRIPPGHAAHVFDWDPAALSYTPTGQHCPPFFARETIQPGECFEVAGIVWQAHAAPGHDPDALIFHAPSHELLISADALWENGFGVVFPEIEGIDAFDEVSATLDLIESLNPRLVLPGHGGLIANVPAALQRARSKLENFVQHPSKHAQYAAKVLLKFKLLEFQRCPLPSFLDWAAQSSYLQLLHATYGEDMSLLAWLERLCDSLMTSGAARREENDIVNA